MVSEAQKKASAKYQKEKIKQVTIKFSPADADVYDYINGKTSRAGYIKELIRKDMEREATMNEKYPRKYQFISDDGQNVEVKISGDYSDNGIHDWDVLTDSDQAYIEEDDGNGVVDWLNEHVKLAENQRHFVENMIITVMAYNEMTFDQLLDYQANHESK